MFRRSPVMAAAYKDRVGGVLFTAGPLSTSRSVREAQSEDYGSRDTTFVQCIKDVRKGLVDVAGVSHDDWTCVPMQGSGTMGIEAIFNTVTPFQQQKNNNWFICHNGAYGRRLASISNKLGFNTTQFEAEEGDEFNLKTLEAQLKAAHLAKPLTNFAIVHCETSTGMFNAVDEVGDMVRTTLGKDGKAPTIFVDAMSSFGAVSFDVEKSCDVLVTSANKCIQGVPGFSIVVARKKVLDECRGNSRSFTLDVSMQNDALNKTSQFPFTPPVQAIVAFGQALKEHTAEGGVAAREKRYQSLCHATMVGMQELGFELFLDNNKKSFGHIITAYHSPKHKNWNFNKFYDLLKEDGIVIYPGKASNADTFRIGSLGDLFLPDVKALLVSAKKALKEMDCVLPPVTPKATRTTAE